MKRFLNSYSTHLQLSGIVLFQTGFYLLLAEFNSTQYPALAPWALQYLVAAQNLTLPFIKISFPFSALVVGALAWALGFIGKHIRSQRDLKIIQFILDKAQEIAYPEQNGGPKHLHKITLFRHDRFAAFRHWSCSNRIWPWGNHKPWSGWLVPIMRSGHTSKSSKSIFLAHDSGMYEGICGYAWSSYSTKVLRNLPEICSSNRNNRTQYADRSYCPKELIDKIMGDKGDRKRGAQSLGAIPITVGGRLWGVLVFDSQSPEGVKQTIEYDFQIAVGAIQRLLEK